MKPFKQLSAACLAVLVAMPASAQTIQDITVGDMDGVRQKIVGLAEAIPESAYGWRPEEGVRSVAEVYMHIASANFRIPGIIGADPPDVPEAWTRGSAEGMDEATIIEAVNASFAYVTDVVNGIPADRLDEPVNLFGSETNVRGFLVFMTSHLHEHLGQSIAYARANHVAPPWSN